MIIKIKKMDYAIDMQLPSYALSQSSGIDLMSSIDTVIKANKYDIIPTGIKMEIPDGYEIQIRPRSGIALNYGVTVLNTPGTIDSGYRGEIKIIMINHGENDFHISKGMKIAQAVFAKIEYAKLLEADYLNETERNNSGFGSTGII